MAKKSITGLIIYLFFFFAAFPTAQSQVQSVDQRIHSLKQQGVRHYRGVGVPRNLERALALYSEAANLGDPEAKFIVGGMYFRGMGTERDFAKAFHYLHGAALKGKSTSESKNLLGEFFLTGHTVPQNYEKAAKWYRKAAENGDRDAQSELAFLYFVGRGVEQDFEKALSWFEKAAMQGLAPAQYSLGIMFYSGNGVDVPDPVSAHAWLSVAAANNHPDAIRARDYLLSNLSREDLTEAQRMATRLHKQSRR